MQTNEPGQKDRKEKHPTPLRPAGSPTRVSLVTSFCLQNGFHFPTVDTAPVLFWQGLNSEHNSLLSRQQVELNLSVLLMCPPLS